MGKLHYKDSPSEKDKKYFAKFLAEDEELILVTGYGATYLRQKFIVAILLPGGVFLIAGLAFAYVYKFNLGYGLGVGFLVSLLSAYLRTMHVYNAHRYLLTTRRVIIKIGVFNVKLTSALYDKITHMEVDQGFLDRVLMHHGKLIINTAGMNKAEIVLDFIDSPVEFKNLLERLINREREHFGRARGPVTTLEGELVEE
jgi:uncharacterized membrane protein YdbT with pleckstrin-like domain